MRDLFLTYLKSEKRYSAHTLKAYQSDLEQFELFLKSTYPDLSIGSVRATHIRTWLAHLKSQGTSNRSIGRKLASLKSLYKFALRKNLVKSNPSEGLKAPKISKKLPVFVNSENILNLFEKDIFDDDFEGRRDRLVMELLYGTGIRLSELIDLKLDKISFGKKLVRVHGKGNKDRVIPLHDELLNTCQKYIDLRDEVVRESANNYLILKSDGQKVYPMLIYRIVKKYLEMVTTVEKKSPHVLRHTFATHLLNKGADLNAIKDLLGHENLAATQVYTHNSLEQLKTVFKKAHPKS